jgi:PAS domain S-box-containing protein
MRKYCFLLISLFFMQLIAPLPAGSVDPIRVGVTQNTPLTFSEDNGKIKGFFIDILEYIANKEGWDIEYVPSSWPECLSNLKSGKIDLLGGIAYSELRGRNFDYTFESIITNWGQMYLNKKSEIESIVDLKGKKIAVLQNDIYFNNLRELVNQFGIQCRFIEAFEYEDVLEMVEIGRCEAGLVSQIYGLQRERDYDIAKSSILLSPQKLYWAAPKGKNQELLYTLDSYLRELKKNQQSIYHEALANWFGIGVKPTLGRWFKWIIISFVALLSLFFTVGLMLRVQVKSKTDELLIKNEELIKEINYRKQALERTERLNHLNEELLGSGSLNEKLRLINVEIVKIFKADFARIWMIKPGDLCDSECQHAKITEGPNVCRHRERCLHLMVSSGRYTHIDGGHRRVPLGCYKIGRVAAEDEPKFITNDVINDPRIHDHEWARKLGLVSFAGYRLLSATGRVIGVLALFSKQAISSEEDAQLESLAGITAQIIQTTMAEEALRKSEERLRAVFEAAKKVSFIITDAQDHEPIVLEFSPGAEKIFGYSKTEMVGNPVSILHLPNDVAKFPEAYKQMREGKIGFSGETTLVRKSGEKFPALFSTYPLLNERGEMYAALGVSIDISEQKGLEVQLRQAHKIESIGTLAGGIAHDINNILGIILGNAELAMDDVPEWNPARLNLEEVRTASLRAKDVVRQLLSFARKTKLEKKPTNIIPIIKESLKLLRSSIPTSIEIRQNIPKDIDTILADPSQINQVLINLCTNADHAMPGEGVIKVTLKNIKIDEDTTAQYPELNPGCYVNLIVSDMGHGISQEDIDRIFDPYFTTKEIGKGTGMGLAVVHGIVKGHNGLITVESELGKGTTFNIYFPVIGENAIVETETFEELPTGSERILFIDDEESLVKMGHQRLERLGYKVEATIRPIEALELFRSQPDHFDLVITDLTMPKMTGDKLVKEILNIRSDIPIILCTGFSDKIDEKKAKAIGAADYIEKPLDKRDFALIVRKVLDGN